MNSSAPKMAPLTQYETALAANAFDKFSSATTMKQIMSQFRELCSIIKIKPNNIQEFYPSLKAAVRSWKAHAIFKKLDVKYNSKVYNQGRVCPYTKLLIIGAGPCGLRSAIDAQLLGAKVVVIEKRDRMSRNNILHLWPFVIEDLKNIGAKKFFGKFCAGAIDHISIRQLQLILLKVALVLGVEVHENVAFERLIEPSPGKDHGWRAFFSPVDHPVSKFEFDVLIGADGKRNTLPGFKRNEFRGKLAIAITANFINRHSKQEASVPEISGTSFVFKQSFFIGLREKCGIDLENIVYYKDDTHYFVMTAKKQSLLERKVLIEDFPETLKLLSRDNVNNAALKAYALDAAEYATDYHLQNLEFAVNHYGHPDVSVFDFTSMFAAENSSKVLERAGYPLLTCLVGDSLLEPFWPTGSGCARGFLSSLDACWALRLWASGTHPLHVLAERESIYRLLAQTTPSNLNQDIIHYTVDPTTRYVALNKNMVGLHQVIQLFDTDHPVNILEIPAMEHISHVSVRKKQKPCTMVPVNTLLDWVRSEIVPDSVSDLIYCFRDGTVLMRIIHNYRPELIEVEELDPILAIENNQAAMDILEKLGVPPFVTATELSQIEEYQLSSMIEYMSKVYYLFKGEIPYTFYKKQDSPDIMDTSRAVAAATESRESDSRKKISSAKKKRRSKRDSVESPEPHTKNLQSPLEREDKKRNFTMPPEKLLEWFQDEVAPQKVDDLIFSFRDGTILCKILNKYAPKLINKTEFNPQSDIENNKIALESLEKLGVQPFLHALEMTLLTEYNLPSMIEYLTKVYRLFNENVQTAHFIMGRVSRQLPEKELMKINYLHDDLVRYSQERRSSDNRHVHPSRPKRVTHMKCASIDHKGVQGSQETPEDKINAKVANKKPKDLMRAIGQIKESDWQMKQLEKKIRDTKFGAPMISDKERVPKWDKTQFLDRQSKITDNVEKSDEKYQMIDSSLKQLEVKLKEGSALETGERGRNKVSALAGQFNKKKASDEDMSQFLDQDVGDENVPHNIKQAPKAFHHHNKVEVCHACAETVYLMEKISPEDGLILHKKCFKCLHCSSPLKISSYMFDRDGKYGYNVFCPNHFGIMDKLYASVKSRAAKSPKPVPGPSHSYPEINEPDRQMVPKGDTPERIEIISRSDAEEDQQYEMDEDEWTDRNFGSVSIVDKEKSSSDDESTSSEDFTSVDSDDGTPDSYSDSDSESSSDSSEERSSYEYSTAGEEAAEGTWGSEGGALELRRREVAVGAPRTPSPSDTEVASNSNSKHSGAANSATEVSTDSEFGPMDVTPTIEIRPTAFNDHKKKNNKQQNNKKKQTEQVRIITEPERKFTEYKPILPSFEIPLKIPRPGDYYLSRTQSTTGIATRRALELKKQYLFGSDFNTALQKSDSASELNSKFLKFHNAISDCQRLLNPASEISPSMQAFLENSSVRRNASGLISPGNPAKTPPTSNLAPIRTDSKRNNNIEVLPSPSQSMPDIVQTSINSNIINRDQTTKNITTKEKVPTSPVFKIVVPKFPWQNIKKNEDPSGTDVDSDSLSLGSSSDDVSENHNTRNSISVPRVEIMKPCGEVMQLDSLMIVDGQYVGPLDSDDDPAPEPETKDPVDSKPVSNQPKVKPTIQELSSSESGNDITAFFADNDPLDWQVDGNADGPRYFKTKRSLNYIIDDVNCKEHICGKNAQVKSKAAGVLERDHSDIDFMDTGSEESVAENEDSLTTNRAHVVNTGFIEFVDVDMDHYNTEDPQIKYTEAVNKHCAPQINYDRSLDYIEQGAGILIASPENDSINLGIELNDTAVVPLTSDQVIDLVDEDSLVIIEPNEEFVETKTSTDVSESKDNTKKVCNSPGTTRKLEELTKEKEKQKDLIHQLVMDKISKLTDKRDRKLRNLNSKLPSKEELKPSESICHSVQDMKPINSIISSEENQNSSPQKMSDSKLKPTEETLAYNTKYLSSETFSLPDIHQSVMEEQGKRASRNVFTVRQRMLSEPDTLELSNCSQPAGIVPGFRQLSLSDFSGKLVQHVESLRNSKESCQQPSYFNNFCTSDPNFFTIDNGKKHKGRDSDRRKSIIKTVSDFFSRRRELMGRPNDLSPTATQDKKNKFQIGSKIRTKSNSCFNLGCSNSPDTSLIDESDAHFEVPPPIPPLPDDYCNAQTLYGHTEAIAIPTTIVPKKNNMLTKKRCKSLNSINLKPCDNVQNPENISPLAVLSPSRDNKAPNVCLCEKKKEDSPNSSTNNSLFVTAREKALEKRHEVLRLQLRDLLNEVTDADHARENAIINEMMAIVTERQAITLSKKDPNP